VFGVSVASSESHYQKRQKERTRETAMRESVGKKRQDGDNYFLTKKWRG
jgi:hypothetical protein